MKEKSRLQHQAYVVAHTPNSLAKTLNNEFFFNYAEAQKLADSYNDVYSQLGLNTVYSVYSVLVEFVSEED